MSAREATFRGARAVGEVIERMEALATWFQVFRPDIHVMTLRRRDLDLLRRWPKAAEIFHVYTREGTTQWRGFTLRADASPARYPRP